MAEVSNSRRPRKEAERMCFVAASSRAGLFLNEMAATFDERELSRGLGLSLECKTEKSSLLHRHSTGQAKNDSKHKTLLDVAHMNYLLNTLRHLREARRLTQVGRAGCITVEARPINPH